MFCMWNILPLPGVGRWAHNFNDRVILTHHFCLFLRNSIQVLYLCFFVFFFSVNLYQYISDNLLSTSICRTIQLWQEWWKPRRQQTNKSIQILIWFYMDTFILKPWHPTSMSSLVWTVEITLQLWLWICTRKECSVFQVCTYFSAFFFPKMFQLLLIVWLLFLSVWASGTTTWIWWPSWGRGLLACCQSRNSLSRLCKEYVHISILENLWLKLFIFNYPSGRKTSIWMIHF